MNKYSKLVTSDFYHVVIINLYYDYNLFFYNYFNIKLTKVYDNI